MTDWKPVVPTGEVVQGRGKPRQWHKLSGDKRHKRKVGSCVWTKILQAKGSCGVQARPKYVSSLVSAWYLLSLYDKQFHRYMY